MEKISRSEAKKQNLTRYFTGIPCKNGHVNFRYTQSGVCADCLSGDKFPNDPFLRRAAENLAAAQAAYAAALDAAKRRRENSRQMVERQFTVTADQADAFEAIVFAFAVARDAALCTADVIGRKKPSLTQRAYRVHPDDVVELQAIAADLMRAAARNSVIERRNALLQQYTTPDAS